MSWLDDEKGKNLLLNGAPLTDRKKLEIIATGATHTDSESGNKTTIDLSAAFAVYDDQTELASVVDLLAIGSLVHTLDGSPWTIVAKGSHASDGGTVVAGSANAALRQYSGPVSARWFGAGTDVSATDNTTALNAAQATGELVWVEPTDALTIDGTVTCVKGFSSKGGIIQATTDATILDFSSRSGFSVLGLDVRMRDAGGSVALTSVNTRGIYLADCTDFTIRDCDFSGFTGDGVHLVNCHGWTVDDCRFTEAYQVAADSNINDVQHDVYVTRNASNGLINNIRSTSGTGSSVTVIPTLSTDRVRNVTISNCNVSGCRVYGIVAYTLANSGTTESILDITITNCNVSDIQGDLIVATRDYGSGFYIQGDVRCIMSKCTATNCNIGTTNDGTIATGNIAVNGCRTLKLSDCRTRTGVYHGLDIVVSALTESITVAGLEVRYVDSQPVKMRANAANEATVSISNVDVQDATTHGFLLNTATGGYEVKAIEVSNCNFYSVDSTAAQNAIQIKGAKVARVHDNFVSGWANHAIYFDVITVEASVWDNSLDDVLVGIGSSATAVSVKHHNNSMSGSVTNKLILNSAVPQITPFQHSFTNYTTAGARNFVLTDAIAITDYQTPLLVMDSASAQTLNATPQSTTVWQDGSRIHGCRRGAGSLTIVAGAGVTVNTLTDLTIDQYQHFELVRHASDEWDLVKR